MNILNFIIKKCCSNQTKAINTELFTIEKEVNPGVILLYGYTIKTDYSLKNNEKDKIISIIMDEKIPKKELREIEDYFLKKYKDIKKIKKYLKAK